MRKIYRIIAVFLVAFLVGGSGPSSKASTFDLIGEFMAARTTNNIQTSKPTGTKGRVILGDEQITGKYSYLIDSKRVGLITNQTGILPSGEHIRDVINSYPKATLAAMYAPEHGIDGTQKAGAYVESYTDGTTGIPVYSIYGKTRKPSQKMLEGIDVLLYDMQDIGSRTYTYISSMYKCMEAAKEYGKKIVVLDRPNPLGCVNQEGFVLKDGFDSFVGIDNLPMSHGMTVGELAKYFNRKIGADLTVVPMENYTRDMVWQDLGIGKFPQTSPNIPTLDSAFCYMMTGSGDGTGLGQSDYFTWVGAKGLNSKAFADKLNSYGLKGVTFKGEDKGSRGGVRVTITDYRQVNPGKVGYYILGAANELKPLKVANYDGKGNLTMFSKICGSLEMGNCLKQRISPVEIEKRYRPQVEEFKKIASEYYIYN